MYITWRSGKLTLDPSWGSGTNAITIGGSMDSTFYDPNSFHVGGNAKFDAKIYLPATIPTDSTTCASGQVYLSAGTLKRKY